MSQQDINIEESTNTIQIVWILILALITFVVLNLIKNIRKNIEKAKSIPGFWQVLNDFIFRIPILAPYIAHGDSNQRMLQMARDEMDRQRKEGKETGRVIFRVSSAFRNNICVCDRLTCKEILTKEGANFVRPIEEFFLPFNIFGVNSSSLVSAHDGEEARRHHRVLAPGFSTSTMQYMSEVCGESVDLLRKHKWDQLLEEDKSFILDVGDVSVITLDVFGKAGMSMDLGLFNESEGKQFRVSLMKVVGLDYIIRYFLGTETWARKFVATALGVESHLAYVSEKLEDIIEQRQKQIENDPAREFNDILSLVVKANINDKLLDNNELKAEVYGFSLVGHESSSTTLKWALYELAKNPEQQRRAREEAVRIGGGYGQLRAPNLQDYPDMNYLVGVTYETVRCHPPAVAVVKKCIKTTSFDQYTIPKGSLCYVHIDAVHKFDPEFNTKEFRGDQFAPERFLDKEFREQVVNNGSWMPFSMGSRKCIGMTFSLIETSMILCRLLQFYEFELLNDESNPKEKVKAVEALVSNPSSNMRIAVRKHLPSYQNVNITP